MQSGSCAGTPPPRQPVSRRRALAIVLVTAGLAGCATRSFDDIVIGPSYQPSNVHVEIVRLPDDLRRVAVLPLTAVNGGTDAEFGLEALEPVLLAELGRVKQFEVVPVSPDQLRRWTGRSAWTGEESLPRDLFAKLRAATGVDAVLICRLTHYRAYQPLVVGWRLKLVDAADPRVLWAVDEVFDARVASVANAARRFAQSQRDGPPSLADSRRVLVSPRRFAHYTADAVFATLPGR